MNGELAGKVVISCARLDLTPALELFVRQQTEHLARSGEQILRIELHLESDERSAEPWFVAKGYVATSRGEMLASVAAEEVRKSVSLLIDNLERLIRR